jgi:hypothetical protein
MYEGNPYIPINASEDTVLERLHEYSEVTDSKEHTEIVNALYDTFGELRSAMSIGGSFPIYEYDEGNILVERLEASFKSGNNYKQVSLVTKVTSDVPGVNIPFAYIINVSEYIEEASEQGAPGNVEAQDAAAQHALNDVEYKILQEKSGVVYFNVSSEDKSIIFGQSLDSISFMFSRLIAMREGYEYDDTVKEVFTKGDIMHLGESLKEYIQDIRKITR